VLANKFGQNLMAATRWRRTQWFHIRSAEGCRFLAKVRIELRPGFHGAVLPVRRNSQHEKRRRDWPASLAARFLRSFV